MRTQADLVVVGAGLGGISAALAAVEQGLNVVLTEECDWLGGQATAQAVPFDDHPWVDEFGAASSYRRFRTAIRDYYRTWYPMRGRSLRAERLNPGGGRVGFLCAEPRVILAVIEGLLAPYRSSGQLRVLQRVKPIAAEVVEDRITAVRFLDVEDGQELEVSASYVIDATDTGEVLVLGGVEHVSGSESRAQTGEPHAGEGARPLNMQAFTVGFAMDYLEGEDHTIERPRDYDHWRAFQPPFWPGPQLGWVYPHNRTRQPRTALFRPNSDIDPLELQLDMRETSGEAAAERFGHRRIIARKHFEPDFFTSDITIVNWPMTDYVGGPLYGEGEEAGRRNLEAARQQSLSFLYWMQTEAPREDGGEGFPGLRIRPDLVGTKDGLAKQPYVRESRRIVAHYTVTENDIAQIDGGDRSIVRFDDTVGVGSYRIDLHASSQGDAPFDVASRPFEIPLRALVPVRIKNLLPGAKNIGTTHISNGAFRMHDTEWNVGEVSASLIAHSVAESTEPHAVVADPSRVADFQRRLGRRGVPIHWPNVEGY